MRWLAVIATSTYILTSYPGGLLSAADVVPPHDVEVEQEEATGGDPMFQYIAEQRLDRDPFEPLVVETPPGPVPIKCKDARPPGPLERFDLSVLNLVGIVWGQLGYRGMIRAPDNKGYFVAVGTYMGENCGRVVDIAPDRLVIEEKYQDTEGNIVGKSLDLPLRRKEKEEQEL